MIVGAGSLVGMGAGHIIGRNRRELKAGLEVFKSRRQDGGIVDGLKDAMRGAHIVREARRGSGKKAIIIKGVKSGLFDNVQHHNKIVNRSPYLADIWARTDNPK